MVEALKADDTEYLLKWADQYDALQDNPTPVLYKFLDLQYPNSKFILTIREPEQWIDSVCRHFKDERTPMREYIYGQGAPIGNEELYLNKYNQHNQEVMDYFQNRTEDLLIADWSKGDGWESLCGFLGKESPNTNFPHRNKDAGNPIEHLKRRLKNLRDRGSS